MTQRPVSTSTPIKTLGPPEEATMSTSMEHLQKARLPSPTPIAVWQKTPTYVQRDHKYISDLLQTFGSCSSPCLWGIIPGQTRLDEVQEFLIANDLKLLSFMGNYGFIYGKREDITMDVSLTIKDNIVIGLELQLNGLYHSTVTKSDYSALRPENVLRNFGKPSQVIIDIERPHEFNAPQDKLLFDYIFFYDDQKIIVYMSGGPIEGAKNGFVTLCPGKEHFSSIRLWMGENKSWKPESFYFPTLEEAASITIDEFSDKLIQDPEGYCIALKGNVFKD